MKISASKTEILYLLRNPVECSLQVGEVSLKQEEIFKYLGVAFTSDGRQDEEPVVRSNKASAVMGVSHHSVVLKRELSKKAYISVFKSIFVPIFIYNHGPWVMTEKVRSQMQASEMRFLQKLKKLRCLRNFVKLQLENLLTSNRSTSPNRKIST